MELNIKKCKCMRFSRTDDEGHQLEIVDSFIVLGILVDTKLNFNDHITLTVNKTRSTIGFIKRWARKFSDSFITNSYTYRLTDQL